MLNGWIVTVGCQTVVYQDRNQLVTDLDAYLRDPSATEQRFLSTSVNQSHTNRGDMPATLGGAYGALVNEVASSPTPSTRGLQAEQAAKRAGIERDRG